MVAFYNEIDPYAAQWLRNLIAAGHIAPGVVDERSICDLTPADVAGFTQVHFFAGIGGWSLAARLAGWPDDRPLWTGSCPCQPFSVAGAGAGQADARHLWPEFYRLIAACSPPVVMGEQVAAAVGKSWLDGVCSDLEGIGYAAGAAVVPACAVDAPHRRDRLWFCADRIGSALADHDHERQQTCGSSRDQRNENDGIAGANNRAAFAGTGGVGVAHAHVQGLEGRIALPERGDERIAWPDGVANTNSKLHDGTGRFGASGRTQYPDSSTVVNDSSERRREGWTKSEFRSGRDAATGASFWHSSELAIGADGKARRVKPGIRLLAHGIPARVGKLRAFGNAIVPQVAAEVIGAYMDATAAPILKLPPLPY